MSRSTLLEALMHDPMNTRIPGIWLGLLLTAACLPLAVQAEVLEEITVTAQKREQNLNDVGISVTAFTAESIDALGIRDSYDVAAFTPGLNMVASAGYSGKINYTLRGVGLNNYSEAQEAAVAVYQDEVYLAPLVGSIVGAFDLDRIEVLRGPQGTLFGRSATGGLVHLISKRPTNDFEGYAYFGLGSYNEYHAEAAAGGPVSDDVSVRLSGYWNKYDGWLKNTLGGHRYGEERYAVRAQALIKPSDRLDILLKAEFAGLKNPGGIVYLGRNIYRDPADGLIRDLPANIDAHFSGPGNDFTGFRDTDGKFFTATWGQSGKNKVDRTLLSAIVTWDIGQSTLTSVTGYLDANKDYLDSNDATPTDYLRVGQFPRTSEFVQELRLTGGSGKLLWTVGGFYFDFDVKNNSPLYFPSGILPLLGAYYGPYATMPWSSNSYTKQSKSSLAAYGQVEYQLTDELTAIAGLRLEHEKVDFSFDQSRSNYVAAYWLGPVFTFNKALYGDDAKIDKNYTSGTVQINWRPSDKTLTYLSARRGIKPGVFNTPFSSLPPEDMKVKEEELMAYEVGFKQTLWDGRAQLNAAAFYYDYNDYQATFVQGATVLLTNADAEIHGLDLEAYINPTDRLQLGVAASLLNGNVKDITLGTGAFGGPPYVTRDREVPNAPKYTVNVFARYEWPAFSGTMSLQGDVLFMDKTYFEIQNHPALTADSYSVGNIRLAWSNDKVEIAGLVKNVWNEKYDVYLLEVVDYGGYANVTPGKPRWWGLEFRYFFGAGK